MDYPVGAFRLLNKRKINITGFIYDGDQTTPVENAQVSLGEYTTQTAANGSYTLYHVHNGLTGTLRVAKTGYAFDTADFNNLDSNKSQNLSAKWWSAGGAGSSCVAAWKPKGAADYASSKIDVATGNYSASNGTAFPTWSSANGWMFNRALSQYLTTTLIPSGNQTWSVLMRYSNLPTVSNYQIPIGAITGSAVGFALYAESIYVANTHLYFSGNAKFVSVTSIPASGRMEMCGKKIFMNGASDGADIASGTGTISHPIYIGCRNDGGTPAWFSTCYIQGISVYNASVASYISSLDAALAAI